VWGEFRLARAEVRQQAERQNSQSGFSSKKVRISSNRHHHIELVASLGASPLASAGIFASKLKGFLKSISSRSAARRRFIPQLRDIARRAMSRFFFFRRWRKAKRDFIKLSMWRFLFQLQLKN